MHGFDTDPRSVAVMAALALISPEQLAGKPLGNKRVVEQHLAKFGVSVEDSKLKKVLGSLGAVPSLHQWSAGELRRVLANRVPHDLEKRALVALIRFAGELALPPNLNSWLGAPCHARYRQGLSEIVRFVARMIWDFAPADAESSLLIHCLLDAPDIKVPRWCDVLFEHPIRARQ